MILILKFIPAILSIVYLLGTILNVLNKSTIMLSYLGFVSILPGLFILLSSFVFKFCIWHRLPLYFILTSNIINWFIWKIFGEISINFHIWMLILLAGIFTILGAYFKLKHDKQIKTIKNVSS